MEEPVFEPIEEEIVEPAIERRLNNQYLNSIMKKKKEPETYESDDNIEVDQRYIKYSCTGRS